MTFHIMCPLLTLLIDLNGKNLYGHLQEDKSKQELEKIS